ncbi:TnsA-like heteromeric transposase endonuclease subunit [Microbacterium enclense]|uniref:TnsA-like heteromeric transposase endonuclease subunit n=1 Tax=Microbacterium enclense TaxID=993073 RepID=UPI0013E2FB71|nr:TnsA-like heteromeric transposase endonuclease subunit [Microbacterium enclense]
MDLTSVLPAVLPDAAIRRGSLEVRREGVRARVDFADMGLLRPQRLNPVRSSTSYKDKPNYSGFYWAATTGRHVWFESLYEKMALTALDRDPAVISFASQPFEMIWASPRKSHFPDVLVERDDRSLMLVDVRPRERIRSKDAETFGRTSALCDLLDVDYRLFADLTAVQAFNLRFLAGYRFERWNCPPEITDVLRRCVGESRALRHWIPVFEGGLIPARGLLLAAIWHGVLEVDLSARLEMDRDALCTGSEW